MHDVLTPSPNCSLSKPTPIFPYRPIPEVNKHSSSPQLKSCTHEAADPIAWLRSLRTVARVIVAIAPFVCQIGGLTLFEASASAQTTRRTEMVDRIAEFIDEASGRLAVTPRWIRAVMTDQSMGDSH